MITSIFFLFVKFGIRAIVLGLYNENGNLYHILDYKANVRN
jgi:hypothetical protein